MSMALIITDRAGQEVDEIQASLEADGPGKGVGFRSDLIATLRYVQQFPGGFIVRYKAFRFAPLQKYKYHVIYSIGHNRITVHRIRHMHQRPLKRYSST
jgi:plasmid stabilization system protein ParE